MSEKKLGMQDFAEELRKKGNLSDDESKIVKAFSRPREVGYAEVKRLNLPTLDTYTNSADELLSKFEEYIPQDREHNWYVGLDPKENSKSKERIRIHSVQTDKIVESVKKKLLEIGADSTDYMMTIAETYPHEYGGTIVVKKDGEVYGEFVEGNTSLISQGLSKSENIYRVVKDSYTNTFKYYKSEKDIPLGDDESSMKIKDAFWKTMKCIPHDGINREIEFEPGYYEFALVKKASNKDLEPIFIDYSADEVFIK